MKENSAPATTALHADRSLEINHGIAPPIVQSVTFFADGDEDFSHRASEPMHDHFYSRYGSPTSSRIAKVIAELEGAEDAIMFGSGMAAIATAVLAQVAAGDHVVAQTNHYMGTTKLMNNILPRFGVSVTQVDQTSVEAFERAIRPETKLIMTETPVNPTMQITDLAAVARLAKAKGILTFCDNTFATPINQRPLELGIDLVCHSVTKFIGGHHDLLAGAVAGPSEAVKRTWEMSLVLGGLSAPFNSWLALRGVRTLAMRMRQHNHNALTLANYLEQHPKVARVYFPGLESHPQHQLARQQMSGFGGVLSLVLEGGYAAGAAFLNKLSLVQNAASLGGVDSIAIQPAAMWGGRLSDDVLQEQGIEPGMIRISVGVEETEDLLADVEQALA